MLLSSDETLLDGVGTGDQAAFTTLYDRVGGAVYGLIHQIVVDQPAAERVTQDVLLAVWTSAPSFDQALVSARGWILGIAHRHAVNEVRRDRLAAGSTDSARPMVGGIGQAMQCLSASQRSALELAYFHGMTYWQVAQTLGMSRSSATSTLRDALRGLGTLPVSPS